MNDIEMYISIIDEREADKILKSMGQNVKKNNLKFKKIMVRKALKSPSIKGKNTNNKESPFDFIIKRHVIKEDEDMNEKEFFLHIINLENMKNYEKLANILYHCPNILKQYKKEITNNIKEGREIFKLDIDFENDKEVANYIKNSSIWISGGIEDKIQYLFGLFEISENIYEDVNFQKSYQKIKDMSLKDFQSSLLKDDFLCEKYLIEFIFILTHKKENEDILRVIILESIIDYLRYKNIKIEELKSKIKDYSNEVKNKDKLIQKNEKVINKLSNKIDKLEKEKNRKIQRKEEELKKYKVNLKKEKQTLKKQIKTLNNKLEENNELINRFKDYMEIIFHNENEKLFGVILAMDIKITKDIYPEIKFINYKKFNEAKKSFENINRIYIQREGLSNSELEKIENFSKENNIKSHIESFRDEKELIEKIALLKYREE